MISGVLLFVLVFGQFGQTATGELRLTVTDTAGLPVQSAVELVSDANQYRQVSGTSAQGTLVTKRMPFGVYRVSVTRDGFARFNGTVEIRSAVPTEYRVTLGLAPVKTEVTVSPEPTLLDPRQAAPINRIGADTLQQRTTSLPGRSLPDLVNTQPGWLFEANGILHPRASEYQTQYIVDGLPFTDNRSPAFAPEIGAEDVQAMSIRTGGYPAEYGRKLGGVIEVVTTGQARAGFHGRVTAAGGSFDTLAGDGAFEYGWQRATFGLSAGGAGTDRFLDPPVEENFSNRGTTSQAAIRFEQDFTDTDRLGLILRRGSARFLVPNETVQEEAGQRQDRDSDETLLQFSYQRILSNRIVGDFRGMLRDLDATLRSNAESTPIAASQDRGFREFYVKGTVAAHLGEHELKAGADLNLGKIREEFAYAITDDDAFDPDTPDEFEFSDRKTSSEQSLFVQDQVQLGAVTLSAGLRWDRYDLLVTEHAFSPRVAVAWSPRSDVVFRASYDRAFQTPAFENLLLASSPLADELNDEVVRLPVPPSRGHFYEAGFSKGLFGNVRFDGSVFGRSVNDVADDDLLLNTGVSFPIAFDHADIKGAEAKIELMQAKGWSGFVSYGYMRAYTDLPVTGGLFLGEEDTELLESTERIPATQDQRHTLRGRVSYQLTPRAWAALSAAYGSGLPFEDVEEDASEAAEHASERVLERVDFDAGRVKPGLSFDASAGVVIARSGSRSARLQAEVRNLMNRLNVINFSGLFSGTALAPPRSFAVRLSVDF